MRMTALPLKAQSNLTVLKTQSWQSILRLARLSRLTFLVTVRTKSSTSTFRVPLIRTPLSLSLDPLLIEPIFRIDSNKGIKAKSLSAWDTNIRDVADPVSDKDAVNLRSVQSAVGDLEQRIKERLDSLIVETSSGQMKWQVVQHPMTAGTFTTYDRNGSTTYSVADTHDLQVNNTNLSGYDFHWDRLEPGMYLYMSGPLGLLVRFRVVAEPVDNGAWTSIKVADGFVSPDTYAWYANDEFDVAFRTFTGGSTDLDEYLPIDGSKAMTGPLQADTKVTAKVKDDGNTFETAVVMAEGWRSGATASAARLTLSNKYNNNAYATIDFLGTSEANRNVQFDGAKFEFKKFGSSRDGFTIRGRANNGSGIGNNANYFLSTTIPLVARTSMPSITLASRTLLTTWPLLDSLAVCLVVRVL